MLLHNAIPLLLLSLCSLSLAQEHVVSVLDTIGTGEILYIMNLEIFNPQLDQCHFFEYSEPIFRFNRVYDFNKDLDKLSFFCHTVINKTVSFPIRVIVNDTNDHIPTFNQAQSELNVAENTDVALLLPTASDPDLYPYNNTLYTISGANLEYFNFLSNPPTLVSSIQPDREAVSEFHFILTATDEESGNHTNTSLVIVVEDKNDNKPLFISNRTSYSLLENQTSGYLLDSFTAEDLDVGANALITYSIHVSQVVLFKGQTQENSDGSSLFRIDPDTAELRLNGSLDFELFDRIELAVQAEDAGRPSLTNFKRISISVVDLHDTMYMLELLGNFVNLEGKLEIPENQNATNADLPIISVVPSLSGEVNLSLLTYPDNSDMVSPFSLHRVGDTKTWSLELDRMLDREEAAAYEFTLWLLAFCDPACDGLHSISFSTRMPVEVIDENDNPPFLSNPPTGCIYFDEGKVGEVGRLNASDSDSGMNAELSYHLISSGDAATDEYFSVNETSGAVLVVRGLDYEEMTEVNITLMVRDGGLPTLYTRATWTLCVRNLDDNPILFDQAGYSLTLDLNSPLDVILLSVHASDLDASDLYYYINSSDTNFSLDSITGELRLNACATPVLNNTVLPIYASNCSQSDNLSFCEMSHSSITFNTVPGSPLLAPSYSFCFPMDAVVEPNLPLFSLNVHYMDPSLNLALKLGLSPPVLTAAGNDLFLPDNVSIVQLRDACANFACNISLVNTCEENPSPSSLNILLTPPSPRAFQFSQPSFQIRTKEGSPLNSTLIDLQNYVCYTDLSELSFLAFSLPSILDLSLSGSLRVATEIDIDSPNSTILYTLTVQVRAGDLVDNASILVTIDPVNDHAPEFLNPFTNITLSSVLPPDQQVGRFTATDADVGSDTRLTYVLTFPEGFLIVINTTGVVYLSPTARNTLVGLGFNVGAPLNTNYSYPASITATDNGSPPLNTSHSFCVFLQEGFMLYSAPPTVSHWVPIAVVLALLLIIIMTTVVGVMLVMYRYNFWNSDTFDVHASKAPHVWGVLENPEASSRENVSAPPPKNATPDSSGIGVSIDSSPNHVTPMTDAEIRHIIDSNRDLVEQLSSVPQLQDYNESSPAPPTLADSELHLFYEDETSQASASNGDKVSSSAPPIDIIYANPDNRYLGASHSPQSSASSSYLSSVSHQRPRLPATNKDTSARPLSKRVPLPSSSTPSFSQKVLAHSQQPEHFGSLDSPN